MRKFFYILLLVFIALAIKNCATPRGPTGGEPDQTGPVVVSTDPENGTTNFDGDEVKFTFDQFVDRNSFRQNVSIQPDLGIQYEVDFWRKSATVKFQSPLPENTTIIVKLGTEVTDTDRNELDTPYDLALSTGDVLDSAVLTARLLDAQTGKGEKGNRVLLYAEPFDLSQRSRYVAETDTSGRIHFGYLSEGTYKTFWIDDLNRNRIWEEGRESAQPYYSETYDLVQDDSLDIGTIYISTPDTIPPTVDGVGLLSEIRLRLRLSEEVEIDQSSEFIVTDTLGNRFTNAIPLYTSNDDPTVLFAQSFEALPDTMEFLMEANNITDKADNSLEFDITPFVGSSQEDTTALQTISHNAGSGLFPDEALEVTYSRFINDDSVVDSLVVLEGDVVREDWDSTEIENNVLRILPEQTWESGIRYQFRVWNPWTQERELIDPEFWQRNQLGGVELTLENDDSTKSSYLTLTDEAQSIRVDTSFTSSVFIDNLPPLQYKAIVFEDGNGDERWNPGTVVPFAAPEPYVVRTQIPVREGFTAEATISYRAESGLEEPADSLDIPEEINENPKP